MNKIFSIVRNSLGKLVVANEFAKSKTIQSSAKNHCLKVALLSAFFVSGLATAQEAGPMPDDRASASTKLLINAPEYGSFSKNISLNINSLNSNSRKVMAFLNPSEEVKNSVNTGSNYAVIMNTNMLSNLGSDGSVLLIGERGSEWPYGLTSLNVGVDAENVPETLVDASSELTKKAFGKLRGEQETVKNVLLVFFDDSGAKTEIMEYTMPSNLKFNYSKSNVDATNLNENDVNAWREKLNIQGSGSVINNYTINLNNVADGAGVELGTGSRARGIGSIATGMNSVAIGKNAVATGGGESFETLNNKLAENKAKLDEIQNVTNQITALTTDIDKIKKTQAKVIEAGKRVEIFMASKATAYNIWQEKLKKYNDAVAASEQFLATERAKIEDLNARINGLSRIENIDISSSSGIDDAATKLKAIVEDGTSLDFDHQFYKDYVVNYYNALGGIRLDQLKLLQSSSNGFRDSYPSGFEGKEVIGAYYFSFSPNSLESALTSILTRQSNTTGGTELYINDYTSPNTAIKNVITKEAFKGVPTIVLPLEDLKGKDINTDVATLAEFEKVKVLANEYKEKFKTYFESTNDPFMNDELRGSILNKVNKKIDIFVKSNEIAYYQKMFEETNDYAWLREKDKAIFNEGGYNKLLEEYIKLPNPVEIKKKILAKFKEENVDAVINKNKQLVNDLTRNLEVSLGINRDAITQKERELASLKTASDNAQTTYNVTNPSESDLALSFTYESVKSELDTKTQELQNKQAELLALRDGLTLNNLADVGQDAYAIGTDATAVGNSAYAIGTNSIASGENSLAIGKDTKAEGINAIAIGTGHRVIGDNSGAFGDPNYVYGSGSYAIGNDNTIGDENKPKQVGNNTFVLGSNISTTANNAVILGANSQDGGDDTVSVGSSTNLRKIVHVADGAINSTSTDAINGRQIFRALGENLLKTLNEFKAVLGVDWKTTDGANATVVANSNDNTLSRERDNFVSLGSEAPTDFVITKDETSGAVEYKWKEGYVFLNSGETYTLPDGTQLTSNVNVGDSVTIKNVTKLNNPSINIQPIDVNNTKSTSVAYDNFRSAIQAVADNSENMSEYLTNNEFAHASLDNINEDGGTVIKNIAKGAVVLADGTNTTVSSDASGDATTYRVNVSDEAIRTAAGIDNINTALNGKADINAGNIVGNNLTAWQSKLGNGQSASGNKGLITGDTLNTALSTKADKQVLDNLSDTVDSIQTTSDNKLDKDLSGILPAGNTVLKELAKSSVIVTEGDNISVEEGADASGNKTYTISIDNQNIKNAIQSDLDRKANKNASNLVDSDIEEWQGVLGTGTNTSGNKGLITGGTLYEALSTKADAQDLQDLTSSLNQNGDGLNLKMDVNLNNIVPEGVAAFKNYAKEAVKVKQGDNVTVTESVDGQGNKTYTVVVKNDAIKTALQNDLNSKANKDGSNIDIAKWQQQLGNGVAEAGNMGLLTGDVVASALELKADKSELEKIKESIADSSSKLETKLEKDLRNITDDAISAIKTKAKEAIVLTAGDNVSITHNDVGDNRTFTVSVSSEKIQDAMQSEMNKKVSKNADNLNDADIQSWRNKLGGGSIIEGNDGLVTGGDVADALALKADKKQLEDIQADINENVKQLETKLNTNLDGITENGVTTIKNYAKEAIKLQAGNNVAIDEKADSVGNKTYTVSVSDDKIKQSVQKDLDAKVNRNASNLADSDVKKWQEKLANGKIEANNKGLVTGGDVYDAVDAINRNIETVASATTQITTQYFGGGATLTTAPTYQITDLSSGQEIAHRNVGSALMHLNKNQNEMANKIGKLTSEQQFLNQQLSSTRKEVLAGTASALAATGLQPAVFPGRTTVSMATSPYKGAKGYALGVARMSENGKFSARAHITGNSSNDYGVVVGAAYTFD